MQLLRKTLASAIVVVVVLSVGAMGASAGWLSLNSQLFRIVWHPLNFGTEGIEVECDVTLEGSMSQRSFVKAANEAIGKITRAQVVNPELCNGGRVTLLAETLPWTVQYESYTGFLPSLTSVNVRILGLSVRLETFGIGCLYAATELQPARGTFTISSGRVSGFAADAATRIPLSGGGIFCPTGIGIENTGVVSILGTSGSAITITLI